MKKGFLSIILILAILLGSVDVEASTKKLSKAQQQRADFIARVVSENWETYGVLPSVAVVQACNESSLGVHCSGNNLWGILSGAVTYPSLEAGCYGYMRVVTNTNYYKNVTFQKDYHVQLRHILDGGYCQPEGAYYANCMQLYADYGFAKYDQEMFQKQKEERRKERLRKKRIRLRKKREKKRKEEQGKIYSIIYDPTVPEHCAVVNTKVFTKGTINIIYDHMMIGIYDVQPTDIGDEKYIIRINDPAYDGKAVTLDVHEEAVG